jgi:hypothetical protein
MHWENYVCLMRMRNDVIGNVYVIKTKNIQRNRTNFSIGLCINSKGTNEEKHKLVHTINRCLDRESNPVRNPLVISRRVLRGITYGPGHRTFYFCRRGFGLVVSV